jgi:hypothetical protein
MTKGGMKPVTFCASLGRGFEAFPVTLRERRRRVRMSEDKYIKVVNIFEDEERLLVELLRPLVLDSQDEAARGVATRFLLKMSKAPERRVEDHKCRSRKDKI